MHLGILAAGIENGVIDDDLEGYLAILTQNSRKWHIKLLLDTDLGLSRFLFYTSVSMCSCGIFVYYHIIMFLLLCFILKLETLETFKDYVPDVPYDL